MSDYIQVFTTTSRREDAEKIAKALMEKRLVACAQVIGPVESIYWWKGKVEKAQEWLCILKSKKEVYKRLEKEILNLHPYEVPEIVVVPIISGSEGYLKWLDREVREKD